MGIVNIRASLGQLSHREHCRMWKFNLRDVGHYWRFLRKRVPRSNLDFRRITVASDESRLRRSKIGYYNTLGER